MALLNAGMAATVDSDSSVDLDGGGGGDLNDDNVYVQELKKVCDQ